MNTRLALLISLVAVCAAPCLAGDLSYKFPETGELKYKVSIKGDVSWAYQNEAPSSFKVNGDFRLSVESLGEKGNIYQLRITPKKSRITVNNEVLEDTTRSETQQTSGMIPTMLVQMGTDGKVYKSAYVRQALFDFIPFLNFFPVLPASPKPGTRWKQIIPSFNFPAAKMPELEFTYTFEGQNGTQDRIGFVSNQAFNEIRKEKDLTTRVTGRNSSNGEILFDAEQGTISSAQGTLDLQPSFLFSVPGTNGSKIIPVPLGLKIRMTFSFVRE
jgi:hypothetical protein